MKKILGSVGVLALVGALIWGATGAFFSDTETSTGNTFTAGAIDLKVDSNSTYNGQAVASATWALKDLVPTSDKFFNFSDIKPGDAGTTTVSLHVYNNDAYVCAQVQNLTNFENGQSEPEASVDLTAGTNQGELQSTMLWNVWRDDNNNGVQDGGEVTLTSGNPANGTLAIYDSTIGTLASSSTAYVGVSWTLPASSGNETQTDSMTGDIGFYVVQSRNNGQFKCSDLGQIVSGPVIVKAQDLAENIGELTSNPDSWLFYNDTNDTVMTINQFSGTGGVNNIVAAPDSVGAAQMTLDTGATPRYNIATYQFNDVKLADIGSLKYRIYDASASAETPYLHFNVDFNNSNTWQSRLIQVPTGVAVNTWTTVDALAGMWHWSGFAKGPDGLTSSSVGGVPANDLDNNTWPTGAGSFDETVAYHTWAEILAAYPNAETRSTDSWLGVRVGHPGPSGETGYVDWVEFDGQVFDFEN